MSLMLHSIFRTVPLPFLHTILYRVSKTGIVSSSKIFDSRPPSTRPTPPGAGESSAVPLKICAPVFLTIVYARGARGQTVFVRVLALAIVEPVAGAGFVRTRVARRVAAREGGERSFHLCFRCLLFQEFLICVHQRHLRANAFSLSSCNVHYALCSWVMLRRCGCCGGYSRRAFHSCYSWAILPVSQSGHWSVSVQHGGACLRTEKGVRTKSGISAKRTQNCGEHQFAAT